MMRKHTAKAVEDEETLETSTLIGQFTDTVEYEINDFLSNGVMTTSIVVSYREEREQNVVKEKDYFKQFLPASSLPVISCSGWNS